MTAVDVDGKTLDPNVAWVGPTWTVHPGAESQVVISSSWFSPVGQADDWLISDTIEVTEANTFLIWQAFTPDQNYRDGYQVRVSTTTKDVASFTDQLLNVPAELTTWQTRSVSLSAYVGKKIFFAFRNNSVDKFLLYMDNIMVAVLKDHDVVVK
jgi:hypothetical protein